MSGLKEPQFTWDPPRVTERTDEKAVVSVDVRLVTTDEKRSEQRLTITTVQKTGWWVCEVAD